jgi:chromosome segregation ATPase
MAGEVDGVEAVEAARLARWQKLAQYLQSSVQGNTPCILDVRAAALILEHVEGLQVHVYALADMIDRLRSDLEAAKAELYETRATALIHKMQDVEVAEASAVRTRTLTRERDEARAELEKAQDARQAFQEFLGQLQQRADEAGARAERLTRDLDATRAELARALNDRAILEHRLADMAERFADMSELLEVTAEESADEPPCEGARGAVVIELGVQIA